MCIRFETASGLRLYATDIRIKLGRFGSLQFLDPAQLDGIYYSELLFVNKTIAKHYRLNNKFLHEAFRLGKITPRSLFTYEVTLDPWTKSHSFIIDMSELSERALAVPNTILFGG